MTEYFKNILPRLTQYSDSLNHKEAFVDKPWVYVDENQNKEQYIFRRDGQLIMSLNGNVQYGKWDFIAPANSLLIDRGVDSVLYNHGFFDKAVMILKVDGFKQQPWMLANEKEIPDLNVEDYLKEKLIEKLQLQKRNIEGEDFYLANAENGIQADTQVYDLEFTL